MFSWPLPKDPDEVYDLSFDWSKRLEEGEAIVTSTVFVDQGTVIIDSQDFAGALVVFWVSGGDLGVTNIITNRVETSGGRTYDWSGRLRVRKK